MTGLHHVTEAIIIEARKLDLEVTAGELVGLVPMQAMVDAGVHYSPNSKTLDENKILQHAVDGLSLDRLGEFDVRSSIIELAVRNGE